MFFDEKFFGIDYAEVVTMCNLKKGDVFIDAGSNLGQEIEYFKDLGITLDSYEPHPYFFEKIKKEYGNLENVTLNNKAVWINNQRKNFFFKKDPRSWGANYSSGGASLLKEKENLPGTFGCVVECVDVADIIQKHDRIKILKIDVEGAEYHLLRRLISKGLIGKPEFIFFEDHSRKVKSEEFRENKQFVQNYVDLEGIKFYNW